ncbi:thiosulfate sulfurtransferase/rhodanese-like domain-containing protein 1 isoform X3 [Heterocephalus glaber]|uniref:Thiosulfate sulfurtransferase/rhodanese-like domain-containing protein 1 isoform X3 n=1 Tax=Heterocephalus glaber TaxID=10181 RepID=A0AAX6RE61_HETGA|nr:thiosulfate sulfurtransferase/rhodanese-like domain-containing protein 1 isoform X3 [Heterocephalus glaber]
MCDLERRRRRGPSPGLSTFRVWDQEEAPEELMGPQFRMALGPRVSELESALQMEPAAFQALYSAKKPKLEDENLVFFCQMGKRGLQATQLAQSLGYTGAQNYAGAYQEWSEKVG